MRKLFLVMAGFLGGVAGASGQKLELTTRRAHELVLSEPEHGVYQIQSQGGDPYLFTEPLTEAREADATVLTFEYFSPRALEDLQIFFAPPVEESNSVHSDLGVREGWTSHSIDLKDELNGWGKPGQFLRFDFGRSENYHIRIRNIHFRKPTPEEMAKAAGRERKKKEEAALRDRMQTYLDTTFPASIARVEVGKDQVIISGHIPGAGLYALAAVPMYHDLVGMTTFDHTYPVKKSGRSFRLILPRYEKVADRQIDHLLDKWVILEKKGPVFKPVSAARYADHIESEQNLPKPKLAGKKGLGGFSANQFMDDLDSLNITSVTVNMWITQMMRSKPSGQTISFEYGGKTYYVDRKWVEGHDKTLLATVRRNIVVSSIILIDKAVNCPDPEIGRIFQHPDCDPSGIYSMANMTSPEGVEYYAAAIDFLAKRYSRPDKKYGRIHHWIIHNEVDAGWVWTNMGDKDKLLFMDTYHKSMRLVQNIARKYNPHSKAFITLTHFWNWTEDRHFYLSRDLLELLLRYSAVEGDFDWGIAHHPYPESLFEPKSWLDKKAEFRFDTPLITFKNIEVLNAWVKRPEAMFLGKHKRTVFLSEQGPNSKDYSEQNLTEQAAAIAYLWRKMEVLDGIDAYQFHNWIDNRGEGGLRIGLRRFPDDKEDPGGRKPIWYVYRDLETPAEERATEFAKKVIGISHWDEVRYKMEIK